MKNEHKKEYAEKVGEDLPSKTNQPTLKSIFMTKDTGPLPTTKKKLVDKALEDYIISSLRPLSTVEQTSFKNLLHALDSRYQAPCRKTLVASLKNRYDLAAADLKNQLRDSPHVACTHDLWSSLNTESFGATTVHFINKEWALLSKVLGTNLFEGQHTSEAIAKSLGEIMTEWDIDTDKLTGVTDNAANECKAFDILNWDRVSCAGHNINLAVTSGLKIPEVSRIIRKGGSIVAYFHRSPLATGVLLEKQKVLLPKECQGHKLITDCPTRWNSTLEMLQRLSEQIPALHAAVHDPSIAKASNDLKSKLFSYDEQVTVDKLIELLKPFKTATVTLSAESTPTLAFVLPTIMKLEQILSAQDNDSNIIKKVKAEMSKNLTKRYPQKQRTILLMASALHPWTKDMNFLTADEKSEVKRLLVAKCEGLQNPRGPNVTEGLNQDHGAIKAEASGLEVSQLTNLPIKCEANLDSFLEEPPNKIVKLEEVHDQSWLDDIIYSQDEELPGNFVESEVNRYFSEIAERKTSPLSWWKERQNSYPILAQLARKYLAIPASSVPSERIFSLAGNLVTKKRVQLSPENINLLIFLHKNQ